MEFAATSPLAFADMASIATILPDEPAVWMVHADDSARAPVVAAAIDDGLAVSVGGAADAMRTIATHFGESLSRKLVISGRTQTVRSFLEFASPLADLAGRMDRHEHLMAVAPDQLAVAAEAIPLRIATADDLPILAEARRLALAEEYDMAVPPESQLAQDLSAAVARAVSLSGVAIWLEDNRVAFTAQLIAKTPHAAMFGDLYTDPELRGQGRATRALATFCSWLMTESAQVTLRVGTTNAPAVRLYERVGFEVIEPFLSSVREFDT
jgi:GNAT superfamily N-acetyltransferase